MIVREATIADIERITEIYNFAILNTVATFDIEPKTVDDRKIWFDNHNAKYPVFVCEIDGVTQGFIALSKLFDKGAYEGTSELSVYIDENKRGNGIGKLLMRKMIDYVLETKCCHTIISRIAGENAISEGLHKKYGFQLSGTLKEVGYKFNRYIDVHFYQWINN